MSRTLEDFIETTLAIDTIEDVASALMTAVGEFGFIGSALGQYQSGSAVGFLWDRMPKDFAATYCEQRWDLIDPFVGMAMKGPGAFCWQDGRTERGLLPRQRDFLAELRARGISQVLMTPLHGPDGRLDLCGLAADRKDPPRREDILLIQGHVIQAWIRCLDLAPDSREDAPELSKRERECLQWLRDGKSNWQISQILMISEKTVEFHVGNLMRKLKAENRLAAVLIAIRFGLLTL